MRTANRRPLHDLQLGRLSEVWGSTAVFMDQVGARARSTADEPRSTASQLLPRPDRGPPGGYYYNGDLIRLAATRRRVAFVRCVQSRSAANAPGWPGCRFAAAAGVVPGTDFLPSEIQHVSEQKYGAYAMLSFGNDEPIFGNVRLDGNIGVRYVATDLTSAAARSAVPDATAGTWASTRIRMPSAALHAAPLRRRLRPPVRPGVICKIGPAGLCAAAALRATGVTTPTSRVNNIITSCRA